MSRAGVVVIDRHNPYRLLDIDRSAADILGLDARPGILPGLQLLDGAGRPYRPGGCFEVLRPGEALPAPRAMRPNRREEWRWADLLHLLEEDTSDRIVSQVAQYAAPQPRVRAFDCDRCRGLSTAVAACRCGVTLCLECWVGHPCRWAPVPRLGAGSVARCPLTDAPLNGIRASQVNREAWCQALKTGEPCWPECSHSPALEEWLRSIGRLKLPECDTDDPTEH